MPGYLGNFPNAWVFGKFPKCQGIWEISPMSRFLGNFPNAWVSGKFPNCLVSGKFPKCLGIWEISQIPRHLRNFQIFKKYPPQISIGIWEIS